MFKVVVLMFVLGFGTLGTFSINPFQVNKVDSEPNSSILLVEGSGSDYGNG